MSAHYCLDREIEEEETPREIERRFALSLAFAAQAGRSILGPSRTIAVIPFVSASARVIEGGAAT